MTTVGTCPSCGAELSSDAPKGFCPRCLYRLGFGEAVASRSPAEPTVDNPSLVPRPSSLPPSFGDYELLEDRGMGLVYKARQSLDGSSLKLLPAARTAR